MNHNYLCFLTHGLKSGFSCVEVFRLHGYFQGSVCLSPSAIVMSFDPLDFCGLCFLNCYDVIIFFELIL